VATGADKGFLNVRFAYAQRSHAPGELIFLFDADGE
jgi:hypothetical protein